MNGNVVNNQIKLHIDDGCLGGGQEINLGWSCLGLTWSNTICDKFFKKTNPQRKNIFTYCALAEDVATIPDVMDISDYQYGFALRTDNEYFQADFEKCIIPRQKMPIMTNLLIWEKYSMEQIQQKRTPMARGYLIIGTANL